MAITKRKDKDGNKFGSYRISVYKGQDENGKKLWHWETFDGNIKQARERETQIKHELKQGTYVPPGDTTVSEFIDKWLADHVKINKSPSTYRGWEQIGRCHLKPKLGRLKLTSLTGPIISLYYTERLKEGLSPRTVTHHREMLHTACQTAIEWGYLQRNPVDDSSRLHASQVEFDTYSPAEAELYLESVNKLEPEYFPYFIIAIHTGIRRSELLGLKWKDVDEGFKTITINRGYQRIKKETIIREPKTRKSRRIIPLTIAASESLKAHHARSKEALQAQGIAINGDMFVFCHLDTGIPFHPSSVSHAWSRIATKAGLKHIRLHDARHTLATILYREGVHPKIVQELLGHSDISTTTDIYTQSVPALQNEAIKKLDALFKSSYNKTVDGSGLPEVKK